jgi:Fic family protein
VDISGEKNFLRRIETYKFGHFKLQLGLECADVAMILQRVQDAQNRFKSSPLSSVATRLEKEVVVSSVFGTNTIEGGELSEQETEQALSLSPEQISNIQQKRAINIKSAYDYIREVSINEDWHPSLDDICEVHRRVYDGLEDGDPHNIPGVIRNNPEGIETHVGNEAHGGVYKPPQNGDDIRLLLESLLEWNIELANNNVPALIRAPLVHLYFEIIHPFWDGNGRVGRVLEAGVLYSNGFRYAPFAQASYYLKNIHKYFALFNSCRKAAAKKHPHPNAEFVIFFLEGMLETINNLHDRVNNMIHVVLFSAQLKRLHDIKAINDRQYTIVNEILAKGRSSAMDEIRQSAWYQTLYKKLTTKTRTRDMNNLLEIGLLASDDEGNLIPGFADFGEL